MSKELDKKIADLLKESEELDKKVQEFDQAEEAKVEEEKSKVEVAPPKPYNVFGRDFSVSEPHIVEYYKNRLEMMTIKYKLLGKFDEDGCYSISTDVKYELVEMQKEIEEMGSDFYKVSAHVMKKYFNFFIKMSMLEEGKVKASLYLIEYAGQNVDAENIETHIGDFIDIYDADFRIKLRKAFNLVDVDAKNNDFEMPNIAVLLQDLIDTEFYMGGLYDMASQIYIMRMVKLLENGGEEEKEILERFKQLLAEMQEDSSEVEGDDKYKLKKEKNLNEKRKELLDKAIDEKGGLEKLNVDKKELKGCIDELNKTDKAIGELSTSCAGVLDIEEIKNLKKPQSSSSGDGSSSGGGKKSNKKSGGRGDGDSKKKPSKKPKKDDGKGKSKDKGGGVFWVTPTPEQERPRDSNPQTANGGQEELPQEQPQQPSRPRPPRPTRRRSQQNFNEDDLDVLLDEAFNEVDSDRSLKESVTQDVLTPAEKVENLDDSLKRKKADDKETEKITRETHGRERASLKLDPPENEVDLDDLEME